MIVIVIVIVIMIVIVIVIVGRCRGFDLLIARLADQIFASSNANRFTLNMFW